MKPIAITLGDPGGIGAEVTLKALAALKNKPFKTILLGSSKLTQIPLIAQELRALGDKIQFQSISDQAFEPGIASKNNGEIAKAAIVAGVDLIQKNKASALVTAPISKTSLKLCGSKLTDHTTLLAQLTNTEASMAFYSKKLKTVLATVHIPLKYVARELSEKRLKLTIAHSIEFARLLKIKNPRFAIAGLNPHAGEEGLMGTEEKTLITPLVQYFQSKGLSLAGPLPPDTLYYRAAQGEFDIVISLYHDQGLIPIKLLAFDTAVNMTLGLPFIRTSPDHGTAFDIAYQNKANPSSMKAAIELALRLSA